MIFASTVDPVPIPPPPSPYANVLNALISFLFVDSGSRGRGANAGE